MNKKNKYAISIVFLLTVVCLIATHLVRSSEIFANDDRNGDKYITNTQVTDSSNQIISNDGTMELNEIYNLEYDWEIPDNTFKKGDVLEFSIPKEFKIVQKFTFNLYDDGNEVARVNILGNEDTGYYISMQFTTDYVETHSSVSGTFELSYILNEKYILVDGENTIIFPDKEIIINVPEPEDGSSGGGGGINAGDINRNKKEGDAILVNFHETPNETTTVFKWSIGLGRETLLGKANSFNEIKHIYIEDNPIDQKMVGMSEFSSAWRGSYGFEGGFFTTLPWDYDGVIQEKMGLIADDSNSYYKGFKADILESVQSYEEYAQENDSEFKQYKLEYYTMPINEIFEDTEFNNEATITIVYEDSSEDVWVLSESQIYNVAEGTITGKTAGVQFKKIDSETNQGLNSAVFDLYKKNNTGNYVKIKSNITSNTDGIVKVEKLTTGDYYFSEVQAPEGYELSDEKLNFSIETSDLSESNQELYYKNIDDYKNSKNQSYTTISVTKAWEDENNQDGQRPSSIQVQLYGNEKEVGEAITLNEGNQWQYTWTELPEKADGKTINYTVKEVGIPTGYTVSVNEESQGNIQITNTYTPEVVNLKGTKTWDDKGNQDGKRPEKITINLLADGQKVDEKVVTEADQWSYEFTNLPKYMDGKEIEYTITENHVADYTPEIKGSDITNHYTPGETSVTVIKAWEDENNQDGQRPSSIQVQLYGNEKEVGEAITLNEGNQWQYTWTELPEKADGKTINYTVKEVGIPTGYTVSVNEENQGNIIITNKKEKNPLPKPDKPVTPNDPTQKTFSNRLLNTGEKRSLGLTLLGILLIVSLIIIIIRKRIQEIG